MLKRYLIQDLGIADIPNSPKPIFRLAHENNLLAMPLAQWFQYANARIDMSHDCDGTKTQAYLVLMPDFIDDAAKLWQNMTGVLRDEIEP